MTAGSGDRWIVPGLMAGLFGSVAGLVLVYIVSLVVIFLKNQELLATLLVAVTFLPLMLIFVFFFPNLVLGIILGLLLGFINRRMGRLFSFVIAAVVGFLFVEIGFSFLLPLIIPPEPGDFVTIASNPFLTGAYGITLGILTNSFLRWFSSRM